MENNKVVKIVAWIIIGSVAAPVVLQKYDIGGVTYLVSEAINGVNKARFNKKMKNGVKEGKIIEIDGEYYTVGVKEEA